MSENKKTLCNTHNNIIFELKMIKKELKRQKIDTNEVKNIDCCIKMCKKCKKMGQKMENRLKKYRNSIEKLGFTRN